MTQTAIYKMNNKDILCSPGKYSYYFVITLNGVLSIKILNLYAVHLKLILYIFTLINIYIYKYIYTCINIYINNLLM